MMIAAGLQELLYVLYHNCMSLKGFDWFWIPALVNNILLWTATYNSFFQKIINMKTLMIIIIIMVSLTAILFMALSSCSKEDPRQWERWEVVDEGFNIGGCIDWSCVGSRSLQLDFCGDALKDAKAGNIIILSEDQCCKKTMTFKRFIRQVWAFQGRK